MWFAIDNSPEVDGRLHEADPGKSIDILPNFNKSGVAGAYNKGFTRLIEMGCQILWHLRSGFADSGSVFHGHVGRLSQS